MQAVKFAGILAIANCVQYVRDTHSKYRPELCLNWPIFSIGNTSCPCYEKHAHVKGDELGYRTFHIWPMQFAFATRCSWPFFIHILALTFSLSLSPCISPTMWVPRKQIFYMRHLAHIYMACFGTRQNFKWIMSVFFFQFWYYNFSPF